MTLLARLQETALHMVRIRRCLKILEVTRNAGRGRKIVVVVGVAIDALAWWNDVRAGERKAGRRVIKRGA